MKLRSQYYIFGYFTVFIISVIFRIYTNPFFNGDMGIIALLTAHARDGVLSSWYFYGQNYFGNFQPILNVFLTIPTGISILVLMFWEHLWYSLGLFLLIDTWGGNDQWKKVIIFSLLLFLPNYLYWSIAPQGHGLIFMMNMGLIVYAYRANALKHSYILTFLIGLYSTLSLWFYIFLIFGSAISLGILCKKYTLNLKHILLAIFGMLIGIIPFIGGYVETQGDNLMWYIRNSSDTGSILYSIQYVTTDFIYLQLNPAESVITFNNIVDLSIYAVIIAFFGFSFKLRDSKYRILYYSILLNVIFMFVKGYKEDAQILEFVRYGLFGYTILFFIAFNTLLKGIKLIKTKGLFSLGISSVCIGFLGILLSYAVLSSMQSVRAVSDSTPTYNVVYNYLQNNNISYLRCREYFDVCGMLAYLTYNDDTYISINESQGNTRNPNVDYRFDSTHEGVEVYELVPKKYSEDSKEPFCFEWDGYTTREYCIQKYT